MKREVNINKDKAAMNKPDKKQMITSDFWKLVLGVALIAVVAAIFLPTSGGPTKARIFMARRDITLIDTALRQQTGVGRVETKIHVESSNRFSASFLTFQTDGIRVSANGTNSTGELLDHWGTPYQIEITIETNYVIRSAGKNRTFRDKDDIVFDSSRNGFVKP